MSIITFIFYLPSFIYLYINSEKHHLLILYWIYKMVKWVTKMVKWVKILKVKMVKSIKRGKIGYKLIKIDIIIKDYYYNHPPNRLLSV